MNRASTALVAMAILASTAGTGRAEIDVTTLGTSSHRPPPRSSQRSAPSSLTGAELVRMRLKNARRRRR